MAAEAWKKEIALIYLPLIRGGSLHCAPQGEMHAVCHRMGTNLKRCQVVRGHRGGGRDQGASIGGKRERALSR